MVLSILSSVYLGLSPKKPNLVKNPYQPRLTLDFALVLRGWPGSSEYFGGSTTLISGTKICWLDVLGTVVEVVRTVVDVVLAEVLVAP